MQVDVELALGIEGSDMYRKLERSLPTGFRLEDRASSGWGTVIRTDSGSANTFEEAVSTFLAPLVSLEPILRSRSSTLRVGVFYETAMCTLRLASCDQLTRLGLSLEVSVYPFEGED